MFEKIDAYNLVANLVPGAALTYALHFSGFPTPRPDDLGGFLLVAFVAGVTTNRIGSLFINPILRWNKIGFLHQKDYPAFVTLEREDRKLETLVANSGLYRTFFTAGIIYLCLVGLNELTAHFGVSSKTVFTPFIVAGMLVFLLALKKEDGYINTRIRKAEEKIAR